MSETDWKATAIERRLENKKVKKKCKELTTSRDDWKVKAIERNKKITQLEKQVAEIKKNIQKIISI